MNTTENNWIDRVEGWPELIRRLDIGFIDPAIYRLWEQAIRFLVCEGSTWSTLACALPHPWIKDIISDTNDKSTYDMIPDLSWWIKSDDSVANYLSKYFAKGEEVWLAYFMAVYYHRFWNGEQWEVVKRR